MSDNSTTANVTEPAPKARKPKNDKRYTVGQMAVVRAKARGIDTSRAAKEIRSRLRANFAHVTKLDKSILKSKPTANDGNRWPTVNAQVAEFILKPNAQRAAESK